MAKDLVEQVKEIEAEADHILAEARRRAAELDEATKTEIAALRKEHERALEAGVTSFKAEVDRGSAAEQARTDEKAQQIADRLASIRPEVVHAAVELILKRLCEG